MFEKAYDCAKTEDKKLLLEIKLLRLGYKFEDNMKEKLKSIDKKVKENRHKPWIKEIMSIYEDFLQFIGENCRISKLKNLLEEKNPRQ